MANETRVLFIYKNRSSYGDGQNYPVDSFGLSKSARLIVEALNKAHIEAKSVGVTDNNDIDREVTRYRASHVIIEALWVVPSKFVVLLPLHPTVKWNVRVHSKTPFLANEGIAIDWIRQYLEMGDKYGNLSISGNNKDFVKEFRKLYAFSKNIHYLPNMYTLFPTMPPIHHSEDVVRVGCFSAIRPMKNQLQQAIAALLMAEELGVKLEFHMNERAEQAGDQVLKNIKALFKDTKHSLILHPWLKHAEFIELIRTMDLGLQVSLTESFNIVSADFASQNIPIVVSQDITWISRLYRADPNSAADIKNKMKRALFLRKFGFQFVNRYRLEKFSEQSMEHWINYLSYGK